MQRVNITLPKDVLKQLQIVVPQGKRSAFIAQAIEDKLQQEDNPQKKFQKSLKKTDLGSTKFGYNELYWKQHLY